MHAPGAPPRLGTMSKTSGGGGPRAPPQPVLVRPHNNQNHAAVILSPVPPPPQHQQLPVPQSDSFHFGTVPKAAGRKNLFANLGTPGNSILNQQKHFWNSAFLSTVSPRGPASSAFGAPTSKSAEFGAGQLRALFGPGTSTGHGGAGITAVAPPAPAVHHQKRSGSACSSRTVRGENSEEKRGPAYPCAEGMLEGTAKGGPDGPSQAAGGAQTSNQGVAPNGGSAPAPPLLWTGGLSRLVAPPRVSPLPPKTGGDNSSSDKSTSGAVAPLCPDKSRDRCGRTTTDDRGPSPPTAETNNQNTGVPNGGAPAPPATTSLLWTGSRLAPPRVSPLPPKTGGEKNTSKNANGPGSLLNTPRGGRKDQTVGQLQLCCNKVKRFPWSGSMNHVGGGGGRWGEVGGRRRRKVFHERRVFHESWSRSMNGVSLCYSTVAVVRNFWTAASAGGLAFLWHARVGRPNPNCRPTRVVKPKLWTEKGRPNPNCGPRTVSESARVWRRCS